MQVPDWSAWEESAVATGSVLFQPPAHLRNPGFLLKLVAIAKIADLTTLSAEFAGGRLVFQPELSLLRDFGRHVQYCGVYGLAFDHRGSDAGAPDLCVRCGQYDRDEDYRLFGSAVDKYAYVLREQPVRCRSLFFQRSAVPEITAAMAEIHEFLRAGVRLVEGTGEAAADAPALTLRLCAQGFDFGLECAAGTSQNVALTPWASKWHAACSRLPLHSAFAPDGPLTVSYRYSVLERMSGAASC